MKRITRLLLAALALVIVLFLFDSIGRELAIKGGVLAGSERLSLWERYNFKKQAEAGDLLAAKRLAGYYGIWRNDTETMMYWLAKSAELGDPVDQYNYGVYLVEKRNDIVEGKKWIKRSADAGVEQARDYLKEGLNK